MQAGQSKYSTVFICSFIILFIIKGVVMTDSLMLDPDPVVVALLLGKDVSDFKLKDVK